MGSFGISEGNITRRKKNKTKQTKKPTDYTANCNSQQRIAQLLASATSKEGLNREARGRRLHCLG